MAARRTTRASAVVAEEPALVAEPALPLTRRQLRELEEQRARTRGRDRDRETVTERFPMLVPGPRAQDPRGAPAHGDVSGPAAATSGEAAPIDTAGGPESRRSRRTAAGGASTSQGPGRPAPTATRRASRGLFRGRPVAEVDPIVAPETEHAPVIEPPPTGTPSASADAWRRTWGLSSSLVAEDPTEVTLPTAGPTPGGRGTGGDR